MLRAVAPGEACSTVPFVAPGAEILVRVSGWPKVERALAAVDDLEALGLDPAAAWTTKGARKVAFGYGLNCLIDLRRAIVLDV